MLATQKMHSTYVRDQYDHLNVQQLVLLFKESNEKKEKDKIYSALFCKLFPAIYKIQRKYPSLTCEQRIEYTDLCLLNSLRNYKTDSKAKFLSYFYGNLGRCFMGFAKTQVTNRKKAVWSNLLDADEETTQRALLNVPEYRSFTDRIDFYDTLDNSSIMNSVEKEYCKLLYSGYSKVADLITIFNNFKYSENKKRAELKKLKDDLKEKIRRNNYKLF